MPHPRVSKKPEGQPTRGKTAANRLRRVDNFILLYEPSLLTRTDGLFARALFVDLGYGFDPCTTLESDGSWLMEALVFGTNFRLGFEITDFQAVLPKHWRKRDTGSICRKGFCQRGG